MAERDEKEDDDENPPSSRGGSGLNESEGADCRKSGKLILDATCTPADIQYPTDTRLLNDAREKLEEIIDILHKPEPGHTEKSPYIPQEGA